MLDIVFAEGIEAIFRFSLALLKKSEDKLVDMDFEQILAFLQSDLFEMYRVTEGNSTVDEGVESAVNGGGEEPSSAGDEEWRANDFVRDAYEIRM